MEVKRLCRDVPLVVIERQHPVVPSLQRLVEHRVRRHRAVCLKAACTRIRNGGLDHIGLLSPEQPLLAAMGVQRRNRHTRGVDPQLPKVEVTQLKRLGDPFSRDRISHLAQGDVPRQEEDLQCPDKEQRHRLAHGGPGLQRRRMVDVGNARRAERLLVQRRRHHAVHASCQCGVDRPAEGGIARTPAIGTDHSV